MRAYAAGGRVGLDNDRMGFGWAAASISWHPTVTNRRRSEICSSGRHVVMVTGRRKRKRSYRSFRYHFSEILGDVKDV